MIRLVILGEAASKANSRQIVTLGGKPSSIKSAKARGYERDALRQIPPAARQRLEGPVKVTMTIYYASEMPDLDESIVLDVLQDRYVKAKKDADGNVVRPRELVQSGVYRNDRQVRWKDIRHAIDRKNPRAEILIEPMEPQQQDLVVIDARPKFAEVPF